ncbi:VOC family protein [Saccharopolyspora sp. NPDC002376]
MSTTRFGWSAICSIRAGSITLTCQWSASTAQLRASIRPILPQPDPARHAIVRTAGHTPPHVRSDPSRTRHIEISVDNFAAAKAFCGNAFGWTFTDYGLGPAYVGINGSDGEVGGFRLTDEVSAGGPLVLLYSDDLDASVQAVRDAGGSVVQGPYEFPGGRRFHFHDPAGNELGVWSAG